MTTSSPTKLLALPDLLKITGSSKSQHYLDIKNGIMIPPVSIGERAQRYPEHEANLIVCAKAAATPREELKTLVKELIKLRHTLYVEARHNAFGTTDPNVSPNNLKPIYQIPTNINKGEE